MSVLYEVGAKLPIPLEKRAYLHARLRNRIYSFVLKKFMEKEKSEGLTKAELARRIGRKPEIITRLLGAPGNWTLETISDLLVGIAGEELELASSPLIGRTPRNIDATDLLNHIRQEKLKATQQNMPMSGLLQQGEQDNHIQAASPPSSIDHRLGGPTKEMNRPFLGHAA
jgi:hypothetical protein